MFRWFQPSNEELIKAIKAKNEAEAQSLITQMNTNELSKVNNNGDTALTVAAGNGLEKVCEMLINKMSNKAINHVNNNGDTALTVAAGNGLEKVCEMLINKMSNKAINQITNNGDTALTVAAGNGLEKVCEMLINKMSDKAINNVNNNGYTALTFAVSSGSEKICELLINKMSNKAINHITCDGTTALTFAVSSGSEKICELLINKMSDKAINHINNDGYTALTVAARSGLEKVCEMLINKMSDKAINHVNHYGNTALTLAARSGLEKVCEMLINKMFDKAINYVNHYGNTALTLAARSGLEKVCEMLINKMTDQAINHIGKNGNTALTWAVGYGLEKVCEMLINKMSEQAINQINNNGETASSLATKNGFKNICDLLTNKKDNLANKANIEKEQEEQQQSLQLKQATSVTNENKPAEIKDLPKEVIKQDITQTNLTASEEDVYGLLTQMIDKLENAGNTNTNIIQNSMLDKIQKLEKDQINLQNIASIIQSIINSNKVTRGMLIDLEDEIDNMISQQTKIDSLTRIDQLNIFKLVGAEVITNLENDNTITANNKVLMQDSINEIISGVSRLINVSDIEKITASMKEFTTGRITKDKLIDLEGEVDVIIVLQTNKVTNDVATFAVTEIVYDKPLLNHPELLGAALKKFSLKEIGERIDELSPRLIDAAINNNDDELVLAGLISLGNAEAPAG
ncbi:ankyrin repeat domain-containing protein [Rickettsia endosymbiont of Orchestes rusci]|uniref:ankyrin repeat domain-containing protein n=1 Tax=Rickettsia endosymbiont of Orchestes rusci TaxID=3066250 RepID=UPI00313DC3A1